MNLETQSLIVPILMVDDRPENLAALDGLLGDQGYDLIKALSGNEALRLTLKRDFALILLDVQMPDMDGFETAELLRKNPKTRQIPIIFVTAGMKDLQFQFKGYDLGAVDFLTKPIEPLFLQSKVRVFAELHRQRIDLERHRAHLENRVSERTVELRRTTEELKTSNEYLQQLNREKEVMLKEIHHRVKNNMQVISSLLNLQAKNSTDRSVCAMFAESRNRINSMALVHEKLYRSEDLARIDFKEYLQSLVVGIADTYKRHDVGFDLDMEPLGLDVNVGIPCGLIVNELVSNCLKYAFPEERKGTIRVGIAKTDEGNYVLTVADNGIGFPETMDFRNTTTLGLQLVNVLAGQIHGTIELSRAAGTTFSITFPG